MWQQFAETIPDILLQLSVDGTVLHINKPVGTFAPADVVGRNVFEFIVPASRGAARLALEEIFAGAGPRIHEIPLLADDDKICWFAAHVGPVVVGGRIVAVSAVARDITVQKQAELALRESEARYRTLVEHAPEAIVVLDIDASRFVDVNANACLLFGLERDELLMRQLVEMSPPTQPDGRSSKEAAGEYVFRALDGEIPVFEWTHCSDVRSDIRCEVRLVRLPAKGKRLVRASIIDMTNQHELERQLHQFQRLDTLGQMASGIAHDFNNILTVISSSADLLLLDLDAASALRAEAQAVRDASTRGAELTQQILSFAKRHERHRERLDLNLAVHHTVSMLRRVMGSHLAVVEQFEPSPVTILGDRGEVEQILVNLLLNACDAVVVAGTVTVSTRRLRDGSVALLVADDGVGMTEEVQAKIFEAFFTTKASGKGTGLGLATVSALVRTHGGTIGVTSRLGEGATFEIIFPSFQTAG